VAVGEEIVSEAQRGCDTVNVVVPFPIVMEGVKETTVPGPCREITSGFEGELAGVNTNPVGEGLGEGVDEPPPPHAAKEKTEKMAAATRARLIEIILRFQKHEEILSAALNGRSYIALHPIDRSIKYH